MQLLEQAVYIVCIIIALISTTCTIIALSFGIICIITDTTIYADLLLELETIALYILIILTHIFLALLEDF